MQCPNPNLIGTTDLWTADLKLDSAPPVGEVQEAVTDYVTESGITVIGYYAKQASTLTLLHWPESRPDYPKPLLQERELACEALAKILMATVERSNIPENSLRVLMGRRIGGYEAPEIAPLQEAYDYLLPDSIQPVHMVSARLRPNHPVEPYGEPAVVIRTGLDNEPAIHSLGFKWQQHHYPVERGATATSPPKTDFYETMWARE